MSKVLTFIALSGGCVVPVFMDLGSSHLFNELWDAHARSHLVWMIASFFLIFILGSYFLFIEKNECFQNNSDKSNNGKSRKIKGIF